MMLLIILILNGNKGDIMEPVGGGWSSYLYSAASKQYSNIVDAISQFTLTSTEDTRAEIAQSHVNKPAPYNLESAINVFKENVNIAMQQEDFDEVKKTLSNFGTGVSINCINRKTDKEQVIAAEIYINTLLDVLDNNPKIANCCSEHFSKIVNFTLFSALLNNPRFQVSNLNESQAKTILQRGFGLVSDFREISPIINHNLCQLVTLTKTSGKELEALINQSINMSYFDLSDSLIKINGGKLPDKESVMNRAVREHDINIALFVLKHEENEVDRSAVVQELIVKFVEGNLEDLLSNILTTTGHALSEIQISNFSKKAESQGNLSLLKFLNPTDWKEKAVSDFKNVQQEAKADKLMHYFLNSNISETQELVDLLKDKNLINEDLLQNFTSFTTSSGRLISRFPNPLEQEEVHEEYGSNYSNYVQQQQGYGNNRLKVVDRLITELKKDPSKSLESSYKQLITKVYTNNLTTAAEGPWRRDPETTPILGRYSMFKKLVIEKFISKADDPNIFKTSNSVGISLTLPQQEPFELTSFKTLMNHKQRGISFNHSDPIDEENPQWLEQLGISKDWEMLVKMKVDPQNPTSVNEFKTRVAEFYWKGVQLMPTERGNSQTMLELHYILYKINGLEPPALSRYAVLPDCIALCSTLEEFQDRYDACWDNP